MVHENIFTKLFKYSLTLVAKVTYLLILQVYDSNVLLTCYEQSHDISTHNKYKNGHISNHSKS